MASEFATVRKRWQVFSLFGFLTTASQKINTDKITSEIAWSAGWNRPFL
ncbi:hypothetical protein VRK_29860 [Vibrio sp. MEBiC08052]|nr:hypothetical protein VRK_29860 [Vibrio sp. MEBiC08052]